MTLYRSSKTESRIEEGADLISGVFGLAGWLLSLKKTKGPRYQSFVDGLKGSSHHLKKYSVDCLTMIYANGEKKELSRSARRTHIGETDIIHSAVNEAATLGFSADAAHISLFSNGKIDKLYFQKPVRH